MKNNLLLLHGALGSNTQFREWKEILADHFDVFDFNFTGHGGRPVDGPFSIDGFVRDTLAAMDQFKLGHSFIFGYSMGGYVALKLAQDYPDRVRGIVTLGTKFHWTPESAEKEVRMMNPEIIEQKIPKFAATLHERHAPEDWKKIMRYTGSMMTLLGEGAAMRREDFIAISIPTLVCIGSEDHMVSPEESAQVVQYLPGGRLKTIEGFRHPFEANDLGILSEICFTFFTSTDIADGKIKTEQGMA